eukprot:7441553-Alexandrium_andersonii.AAC.1
MSPPRGCRHQQRHALPKFTSPKHGSPKNTLAEELIRANGFATRPGPHQIIELGTTSLSGAQMAR